MLGQARLFEDSVRRMARADLGIQNESALGDRAVPDVVITLSVALEATACSEQEPH